jgi:hypothetical protein
MPSRCVGLALVAILAACGARGDTPRARGHDLPGSPADIHSAAGVFAGYEIRRDCPPWTIVVLGIPGDRRDAPPPDWGRFWDHVSASGHEDSTCDHRPGDVYAVDDYRVVDAMVRTSASAVADTDRSIAFYMAGGARI